MTINKKQLNFYNKTQIYLKNTFLTLKIMQIKNR